MKYFTMLVAFICSTVAYADVNCPKAKVEHVQAQRGSILVYLEGQNWHRVGDVDDPGTQSMYSALLAAQMSGKPVVMRYPDGYDCLAYELTIPASMVRTYNQ